MSRHRSHPLITLLAVLVGPVTTACTAVADTAHGPEALRSDSAGVEIILNPGAALAAPVFATLDSVPALRIGTLDGMPEEQFGAIRDVLLLTDGGVAVLDGQTAEIRLFNSAGAYQMSLGSKGQGPGELQSPSVLALLSGDTLAVYDERPMRITRFGPNGKLGRIPRWRPLAHGSSRRRFCLTGGSSASRAGSHRMQDRSPERNRPSCEIRRF